MKPTVILISKTVMILAITAVVTAPAEVDDNFSVFADLVGKQWEGHFEDADEPMTLYMSWEPIIGGAAVQMKGWSSSSDMTRLNVHYWDEEKSEVRYLAMTSNGWVATGTVLLEDSVLTFIGRQIGPDGTARDTKGRWEFLSEDKVRVIGYGKQGDEWQPGHKILYTVSGKK